MQVVKDHYDFGKYVTIPRWCSYWHQINEVKKLTPKSLLVIGVGDGIVTDVIQDTTDIQITTIDIDPNLNPTIIGSVTELDRIIDQKYDCILCCQVLEHLPLDEFGNIIGLISHYCDYLILSLPTHHYEFSMVINLFGAIKRIRFFIPRFWHKHKFDGEHYWEVGARYSSNKKVTDLICKYFTIITSFIPVENSYHHFYVLKSKA